jgi:hypothetical protein
LSLASNARGVFRLIAEIHDQGDDPEAWQRHAATRFGELCRGHAGWRLVRLRSRQCLRL